MHNSSDHCDPLKCQWPCHLQELEIDPDIGHRSAGDASPGSISHHTCGCILDQGQASTEPRIGSHTGLPQVGLPYSVTKTISARKAQADLSQSNQDATCATHRKPSTTSIKHQTSVVTCGWLDKQTTTYYAVSYTHLTLPTILLV